MDDVNTSTVEPLFIKESDMPTADFEPYTVARAVMRVVKKDNVDGVQRIGQLWRIYLKTAVSRLELLARRSLLIQGSSVPNCMSKTHSKHGYYHQMTSKIS